VKLAVFNGSPRGRGSNSRLLMNSFLAGYARSGREEPEILYLADSAVRETLGPGAYRNADTCIFIFPLYTDSVPGIVKEFLERLSGIGPGGKKSLAWIVQSGFPESEQSRPVSRYLEKFTLRLGARHAGTVLRGGVEGIQIMPPWMTRTLYRRFESLGYAFGRTGSFPEPLVRRLAGRGRLSPLQHLLVRIQARLGMADFYWDQALKKNGAFGERFAAPYGEPFREEI